MIYNLGSLNVDRVLSVEHIVRPGETIACAETRVFAGGKGANQSVALARAGAPVAHIGRIGDDGRWLRDKLAAEGIDIRAIAVGGEPTGQAIIQVDAAGQNAIVILSGANGRITPRSVDAALAAAGPGDWLLAQNETSSVAHALRAAHVRGMRVAFNPAPCDDRVHDYPLELVDLLCVNESEAASLTRRSVSPADAGALCDPLAALVPRGEVLLTLGAAGAIRRAADGQTHCAALRADVVDTTAAGDTFLGYYLAGLVDGLDPRARLAQASRAAALCVARPGALDAIPRRQEVLAWAPG